MWNRHRFRIAFGVALASLAGLVSSVSALAGDDQLTVRLTADGQKTALAAVVGSREFVAGSGWAGKTVKPKLHGASTCEGVHAKQSDLVLVGKAESLYGQKATGWQIHSFATVLRTATMVETDWKRTGDPRAFVKCLRPLYAKQSTAASRFVSLRRRPFPAVGRHAAAFRALFSVAVKPGKRADVNIDMIVLSSGRTEISFISTAAAVLAPGVEPAEVRLARILAKRAVS
jgi:hypothetical protein